MKIDKLSFVARQFFKYAKFKKNNCQELDTYSFFLTYVLLCWFQLKPLPETFDMVKQFARYNFDEKQVLRGSFSLLFNKNVVLKSSKNMCLISAMLLNVDVTSLIMLIF